VIKIGRSARAGKATAMENGLYKQLPSIRNPNFFYILIQAASL
jgi:hypothetical protein